MYKIKILNVNVNVNVYKLSLQKGCLNMATMKDIAEKANVSITTVSRVINNKPDVSEETKEKINNIIKELGYQPNNIARSLVLQKSHTIGLLIPDISNPFFPEVAKGIEDEAKKYNYSVIYNNTNHSLQGEKEGIELLKSKQVDGIILSLSMSNKEILDKLKNDSYPVIQIDNIIPDSIYPSVLIDNKKSAYNATQHLIDMGHKDIAHITGDLKTKTGNDRLNGYKKALQDNNISLNEDWILEGDYSQNSGYLNFNKLLKQKMIPTSIFAANDLTALGIYEAALEKEIKIPEDISIIGHDDINVSSLVQPKLTTMAQPTYELGKLASNILINKLINEENFDTGEERVLETKLIKRDSIKKISN